MATIRQSLNQMLAVSQPGETLIVYYEGHGFSDEEEGSPVFFACYDAGIGKVKGWSVRELVARIDKDFKGNRVILMADCCQSGALAEAAGRKDRRLSYACFGSTQSDETSTGNWTFTEALLSAWRGEGPVDADRNGGVSIKEMQNYLSSEMAFAEEQKPTSLLTGTWKSSDVLAKARPLINPREGEHVEVYSEEDWWMARIVDGKNGKYKVFYYGYENDDSEWVSQKRMRSPKEVIEDISAKLGLKLN